MSIITTAVDLDPGTVAITSAGVTAITIISLCNYSANSETASIHIVPSGASVTNDNIFISNLEIFPNDTFIVYQGGEKIILDDGDTIVVIASTVNTITAITSYMAI